MRSTHPNGNLIQNGRKGGRESESEMEIERETQHTDIETDVSELEMIYLNNKDDEDDAYCEDFVDEEENWQEIFLLARNM